MKRDFKILLLFLSISPILCAQHIIEKSVQTQSDIVEIYLDKFDNLILKNTPKNKVSVTLSESQNSYNNLSVKQEKGAVIIKANKSLKKLRIADKYCVDEPNLDSYVISVPVNSIVYLNLSTGNFYSHNFKGQINAELETSEVQLNNINGDIKIYIVDGKVNVKLKSALIDVKSNLGIVKATNLNKNLAILPHSIKGKTGTSKNQLKIQAIKANIYLEGVKE